MWRGRHSCPFVVASETPLLPEKPGRSQSFDDVIFKWKMFLDFSIFVKQFNKIHTPLKKYFYLSIKYMWETIHVISRQLDKYLENEHACITTFQMEVQSTPVF